jgi:hypothetical protein
MVEEAIAAVGAPEPHPEAPAPAPPPLAGPVTPGDRVRILSLGLEGDLEAVQGSEATVLVRGRRVRVPAAALAPAP